MGLKEMGFFVVYCESGSTLPKTIFLSESAGRVLGVLQPVGGWRGRADPVQSLAAKDLQLTFPYSNQCLL